MNNTMIFENILVGKLEEGLRMSDGNNNFRLTL